MSEVLFADPVALKAVCRKHRIRRLSLFGSRLKGTARPDSDVDLLVEFEPDARPTYFDLAAIELELSPLLEGRRVDLRTGPELSRFFRDQVLTEARVQYDAGR
jgi:predicted nucleotidyltransferase